MFSFFLGVLCLFVSLSSQLRGMALNNNGLMVLFATSNETNSSTALMV